MIRTKADLVYYLEADRISLGRVRKRPKIIGDDIWKFQITLRRYEYALARNSGALSALRRLFWRYRFYRLSLLCNFEFPPHVAGPGLSLAHRGPIIVNPAATIGKNCRIHSCVNIGTAAGTQHAAPQIGDNVYIGPGAKLFGRIHVANGIAIAAQAVVHSSFDEENVTIGGIPARRLSSKGAHDYLIDGAGLALGRRI